MLKVEIRVEGNLRMRAKVYDRQIVRSVDKKSETDVHTYRHADKRTDRQTDRKVNDAIYAYLWKNKKRFFGMSYGT